MRTVESCRILSQENLEVTIRVTSSNAQPTARTIRFYDTVDHFPKQHGRIVGFIT
jgi:hypothetical protein